MGKVSRVQPHLTVEEIDARIMKLRESWRIIRWLVVRHALVDPAPATALARRFGLSVFTAYEIIEGYNRDGPIALETPGKGQRQRAYLSFEDEQAFLEAFVEQSRTGQIVTMRHIKQAFEQCVGHPVATSTVSRLLQRHQWWKVIPRPKHPHSRQDVQYQFKKTFRPKSKKLWQPALPTIPARSPSWQRMKGGLG